MNLHTCGWIVCVLGLLTFTTGGCLAAEPASAVGARIDDRQNIAFPVVASVVDVTKPPYNAKGDGVTDDTDALQRALADTMGLHKIVYLPKGTYLVSQSIRWAKKNSKGGEAWGFNWIQGQNTAATIIRLKDGTYPTPGKGKPIMWCGGFGSADWFHNYIQNVTFDIGRNNAGASGLNFYSNNTGGIRSIRILSQDGRGQVGLELGNDMNGPLLVKDVEVRGFDTGIRCASGVNSQTFEHITLIGQNQVGLANLGQSIAIRSLLSQNAVPAVKATSVTCLLDAHLIGRGNASTLPAIQLGKNTGFFGREIATPGYALAIAVEAGASASSPHVKEFYTGNSTNPFGGPNASLNLPIEETPEIPWDDPATWAVVDVPTADDAAPAIQKAVDSGATTLFLANHEKSQIRTPVIIRGNVRRIFSTGSEPDYFGKCKPNFIVADGAAPVVLFEHFGGIGGGVTVETNRTVVFRNASCHRLTLKGNGKLFLEDFGGWDLQLNPGQKVWARQLNIENEGTHLTNNGAALWVLGYKTERGGVLVHTRNGGRSEIFGTFSYTTTPPKQNPMFLTEDAITFAYFHEVCFSGAPYQLLIQETRNGQTRTVKRGEGWIAPYFGAGPAK